MRYDLPSAADKQWRTHVADEHGFEKVIDVVVLAEIIDVIETQAAKVEVVAGMRAGNEWTLQLVPIRLVHRGLDVYRCADIVPRYPMTERNVARRPRGELQERKKQRNDERRLAHLDSVAFVEYLWMLKEQYCSSIVRAHFLLYHARLELHSAS
jgi:hypothetical protein